MSKEAWDIVEELEKKYAGDSEALDVIEDAKVDIRYIEERERSGGYTGQPSEGRALELKGFMEEWY